MKKKIIAGSLALCFALAACEDEKKAETPKALGSETSASVPASGEVSTNLAFKAKARKVMGDVNLLRKSDESWKKLRQGQNVFDMDRIRTERESEVLLGVNDGSVITVSENSDVSIDAEVINELNKKVAVTVKKGKVYFDIQKLKKGNSLEFKTVTAVATIYGTAGFVGSVEGQTVASLKEGRLSVTSETNETAEITESQTVIVNKSGQTKSLKLKSSGTKALAFALDSMAATGGDIAEDESSLQKALESFDNVYAQKQADFEKNTYFHWDETNPDTVYTPGVTLTAKATAGITVTILGESSTVGQDGLYSYTSAWGETEYGVKRFLVNCSNGEVEYQCGMRNVLYVQPKVEEPAADSVVTDSIPQDSLVMQDTAAAETKEEAKTETPEPLNLKVSIDGKAVERIHNPFGSNPRAKGYRGNAYNGYLKIKLSGLAEEQLSEIVNVKVLKNGNEVFSKGSEVIKPPEKTSFSIPIVVNVNTVAEFQVVVRLKNGKSVKSNKKKYEVYCNTRSHDPNDLTRYNGGPVTNKKQEYESVSKELKRE